ncbi:MAG: nuclear transport factor 2 family protein [Gammaproteobacteria bacterium]|nr:nuclear transport factor 2 family protein [Gammaproteobacteria bacterium]
MSAETLRQLHAARMAGDLAAMTRLFAAEGRFEIRGASADKPIAISATSLAEFRPWLAMLVKVFRLSDYQLISTISEAGHVAARWRANIASKVTGSTVPTELIDLVTMRDGLIVEYCEFFVPR